MNGRERVLAHLAGRPIDRLPLMPITMMFAADRARVRYRDYVTDHRALVTAQLHVAEEFDFDYVSCISDPAREAADCGSRIELFDDQPPAIVESEARLADKSELARLRVPDPWGGGRMTDRLRAAALFRERTAGQRVIEGWIEGPCAEAADLRGINTLMTDFVDDAVFVRDLFAFVVEMELRFARAQVEAGIDLMGVGDAAASLVGPRFYEEFVWPYEKKLVDGLHALGTRVRLHICGNTRRILPARTARSRNRGFGLSRADGRRAGANGAAPGSAGQSRPGQGPEGRLARTGAPEVARLPPGGGPPLHCRRGLRSATGHAAGERAGAHCLRPSQLA